MSLQAVYGGIELETAMQTLGLPFLNLEPGIIGSHPHEAGQVSQVNLNEFLVFSHDTSPEYLALRAKAAEGTGPAWRHTSLFNKDFDAGTTK
jgi:hypothetical protein